MKPDQLISKVALVNPPGKVFIYQDGSPAHRKHCTPPLGLAYLGRALLNAGYEPSIIDGTAEGYNIEIFEEPFLHYGLTAEMIVERLRKIQPDVIGISSLFSSFFKEAAQLCRVIKQHFPNTPMIMGGHHPSGLPLEVMKMPEVDYVIVGEADESLVSLLDCLNGKCNLDQVPALYYRKDGKVVNNLEGIRKITEGNGWSYYRRSDLGAPNKIDETGFPAWHLLDMEQYWGTDVRIGGGDAVKSRYAVMVSTRGCPHACFYCTSPLMAGYKGYRQRSNENVVAEIRWLHDEYGVREISFLDDNFYVSKPRVKKLLPMLAQEFPDMVFCVPGGTEVNALDNEVIDLMAESNFYKVLLAIESGDPELQAAVIDKHVNVHRVPQIVDYLKSKKIETRGLFMIGFPDEKRKSIDLTVALARSLDLDDFYLSIVTPLPGTPLYDECRERGILNESFDVNEVRFSLSSIRLPETSAEELESIRRNVWAESFEAKRKKLDVIAGDTRSKKFEDRKEYEFAGFQTLAEVRQTLEKKPRALSEESCDPPM